MAINNARAILSLIIIAAISFPALGMSNGPGAMNSDGELTVKYGCSCHNNGAPSDRAVVMVSGVPLIYEPSESYIFTIRVADSLTLSGGEGNVQAGFLLSSDSIGNFTWDESEEIRYADGRADDISHSDPDLDGIWIVTWAAPSEDLGAIQFWLVGNSVDGGGIPDDMDYWNILSFSVNPPATITTDEAASTLETRTISVGSYDSLFLIEISDEQLEQERQDAISERVFSQGNLFYWSSLVALIVGAVFQKEILERKYDDGPEFLASELAYPQGIRRAIICALSFYFGVVSASSDSPLYFQDVDFRNFVIGTAFFISTWAAYGVYRTIIAARAAPSVDDLM
ncbi:MAG: hypothetical protein CMA12_03635 [Euryarchaeota archaeon]|nr:hypothetical protein [Euryarchaeota archaeon]OUW22579.1 MAG: hypothetical protein CBD33_01980 [Euryarchaeota archaeon TMED173]